MLLCDLLNDYVNGNRDTVRAPDGPMADEMPEFAHIVAGDCDRFFLTIEALGLVRSVGRMPGRLADYLPATAPPRRPMLIEWLAPRENVVPGKYQPQRCGVLIQAVPEAEFVPGRPVRNALELRTLHSIQVPDSRRAFVQAPPIQVMFDTNEQPSTGTVMGDVGDYMRRKVTPEVLATLPPVMAARLRAAMALPDDREASDRRAIAAVEKLLGRGLTAKEVGGIADLAERISVGWSIPACDLMLSGVCDPANPAVAQMFLSLCEDENADILTGLFALPLIRAGAFEVRPADLERLNRVRLRNGRMPFLQHAVVDTPNAYRRQLQGLGLSASAIAEHLRRGHFRRLRDAGVLGQRVTWVRPAVVARQVADAVG